MVDDDDEHEIVNSRDKKITLTCNEALWQIRVNVDFFFRWNNLRRGNQAETRPHMMRCDEMRYDQTRQDET